MKNHIFHILEQWYPQRANKRWALAMITATEGSVYRKAGALMLISEHNDTLGMLSGGCLETDLQLQAQRVIATEQSRRVSYDASDEGSIAWQLGIGCGGVAHILIHPCSPENDYLGLATARDLLRAGRSCHYRLNPETAHAQVHSTEAATQHNACGDSLTVVLRPPPHLLVFGAGVDILPIVNIAKELGWKTTLVDKRASHFKPQRFAPHTPLLNCAAAELDDQYRRCVDAVIIASHSVAQDVEALSWVQGSDARYCGILGPAARRERVLHASGMSERDLRVPLAGPMGLALGGELPESIALSVLAECHAVLFGGTALPLSGAFLT